MEDSDKDILKLPRSRTSPFLILAIGIFAVSTASVLIKFAQEEIPSLAIAAGRMGLATLLLVPFVIPRHWKAIQNITIKNWGSISLAGIFLGLHFYSWITSLEFTSIASSVVLVTTAPLWVAIISPIFLKEKISQKIIAGLCIAMLGGVIVGFSGNCEIRGFFHCGFESDSRIQLILYGDALALVGALFSGAYIVIGRKVRSSIDLSIYVFLVYGIAALLLIILLMVLRIPIAGYRIESYGWLVALAIFPQLIGHSSFNWSLKYLSAIPVAIALLGEPIGSVILAFIFLRQVPTPLEILGGLLILTGILLSSFSRN